MSAEASQPLPAALGRLDAQGWNSYWAEMERRIGPVFAPSAALMQYSG